MTDERGRGNARPALKYLLAVYYSLPRQSLSHIFKAENLNNTLKEIYVNGEPGNEKNALEENDEFSCAPRSSPGKSWL